MKGKVDSYPEGFGEKGLRSRQVFREVLFHIEKRRKGLLLFCGREYRGPVVAAAIPPLLAGGEAVIVDGGGMCDPYVISRVSRMLSVDPRKVLSRFFISRGFTCHQMEDLIVLGLPSFIAGRSTKVLIISGLLETFYDENVPFREASSLFRRTLSALLAYGREIPVMVVSPLPPSIAGKRALFFKTLARSATTRYGGTENDN